jgi:hypothetical protein
MFGYLGCCLSSAFVLSLSEAGHHIHDCFHHIAPALLHLCLLAMNFHWCDILHMQISDYTAKCPRFHLACHLWIDNVVIHHAYGVLSWLYDDKGDLHMPFVW